MTHIARDGIDNPSFELEATNIDDVTVDKTQDPKEELQKSRYGWGSFKPDGIQSLNNAIWLLVVISIYSTIQQLVISGIVNTSITTLERRFGLTSIKSGLMVAMYDIAGALVMIPVSYFGNRHKMRWITAGLICHGIGSAIFFIPHFSTGKYSTFGVEIDGCIDADVDICGSESTTGDLSGYLYVFLLAQIFHGVGMTPLYTLGNVYIDENVSRRDSPLYLGIFFGMSIVGPAIGFLGGGALLNIPTDLQPQGVGPDSTLFVGAWWIGFVIASIVTLLLAIPMSAFPRRLPTFQSTTNLEAHKPDEDADSDVRQVVTFRNMSHDLWQLVRNPVYVLMVMCSIVNFIILQSISSFGIKFLQSQFGHSAAWASIIFGLIVIPAGFGGTVFGGFISRYFRFSCANNLRWSTVCALLVALLTTCFAIHCPDVHMAGLNTNYHDSEITVTPDTKQFSSTCNSGCHCNELDFSPVCGADDVTYYSACYAGCDVELTNCLCVSGQNKTTVDLGCSTSCRLSTLYYVLFAVLMLIFFSYSTPSAMVIMKCVSPRQRSLAFGLNNMMYKVFGSIPAPILLGLLIDNTCILWQTTCSGEASCLIYENYRFSMLFLVISITCTSICFVLFLLATILYKPVKEPKTSPQYT